MAMQHVYARGEKGLYSGSAGYDTVQISKGLEKFFVERHIHPYCVYKEASFKDEENNIMPDVYFMTPIHSQNETLIFGRNIYKMGVRNSFLSHIIVVTEPGELQTAYTKPDALINYNGFLRDYGTEELPTLDISKLPIFDMFYTKNLFFELVGITEQIFKSVLYYIIQSYFEKKQLYIKLDLPRKTCSEAARQFMRYIFEIFPIYLRKKISYITYSPFLVTPNFFNVVFLDRKADLNEGHYGYVLDLTSDTNFVLDNRFLQLSWININNANKTLLELQLDCDKPNNWSDLVDASKAVVKKWRSLRDKIKNELGEDNYYYFLHLIVDLCSYEMHDNSLFIIQQYINSSKPFEKAPVVEEMEYIFNKNLTAVYSDLACFNKYSINFYGEMFNKLRNAGKKFKFLVLARFYLNGASKYFNKEIYNGLTKRLCDTIQEVFEIIEDDDTDYLTKKMQEVIIGELSVYLRKV